MWSKIFEFSNFNDRILEQEGTICYLHSAKQQLSNINNGGGIRPNVCPLTFGPPCTTDADGTWYWTVVIAVKYTKPLNKVN